MIFSAARSVFWVHTGDWLSVRPAASERILGEGPTSAPRPHADDEHREEDPAGLTGQQHGADAADERADPNATRKGEEQSGAPRAKVR